jgi:hypothetical protein
MTYRVILDSEGRFMNDFSLNNNTVTAIPAGRGLKLSKPNPGVKHHLQAIKTH